MEPIQREYKSTVHAINKYKPPATYVKLNMDGSGRQGLDGASGIIQNCSGKLICAFAKPLGTSTSNWAEISAMLHGVKWCLNNVYTNIIAESNSKILLDYVMGINNLLEDHGIGHRTKKIHYQQ
ncbi:hypothetical protein FXO38_32699 [Capsicum annuum]|nr:hypothetical protein FXO38_32699 [Capsicum annuum]KAF3623410.1 hypothetical protein FXO37_31881 [Capsicum annuum]